MQAATHLLTRLLRARSRVERLARSTPLRLLFFACLALASCWVALRHAGQMNMYRDGQVLLAYEEAARKSVASFGQAPLWNPYYCGGMYGLGSPQSRFASPTFLLSLIFGVTRAEPLIVFFMMLVGLEGAFRYARTHHATSLSACLAAPVFALSGQFAFSAALGWTNFLGFELLPWVLLGFRRAASGEARGVAMAALSLAWIVGFGGTYAAPMSVPLVLFEVAALLSTPRFRAHRERILVGLGMSFAAGVLALFASAVRLWPVSETIAAAPRLIGGAPGISVRTMLEALLKPIDSGQNGDFNDGNGTYYVGIFVAAALLAGILRRDSLGLVITGYVCSWLAAGYGLKPSLFAALRTLPVYDSLRYPERFLIPLALYIAAIAAVGLSRLLALSRKRPKIGLPLALVTALAMIVGLYPLIKNHYFAMSGRNLVPPPVEMVGEFHQARGNRWGAAYYPPMNRGSLSCWDAYPVPESPLLRGDRKDEAYLDDPTAGTVTTASWSPSAIDLDVDLKQPARVRINQNAHAGWRASVGNAASDHGLLVVDLPAGRQHVAVRFLPRSAIAGGLASLAAIAVVVLLVRRQKRHGRVLERKALARTLMMSLAPGVPIALALALWHQPSAAADLKTTEGEDLVVDAPPADAKKAGVVFQGGLELVAVRTSTTTPAAGSTMTIELDWRSHPPVKRGMGVFMHIDGTPIVATSGAKEDHLNGDHPTFSGVLDPDHVPEGKIVRDIIELSVPEDAGGKTWKVWAGLWMLKGTGERITVTGTGSLVVEESRVLIATFDVK